jgi:phosphohistidine phosphatase
MEIYLLRHAIAVPAGTAGISDEDREITEEGYFKMTKGARGLSELIDDFDLIVTSPLKRAVQTSEIIVKEMGLENKVLVSDILLPSRKTDEVIDFLEDNSGKARVLLIGHEPSLSKLAGALCGTNKYIVEIKKGGLCRIDVSDPAFLKNGILVWNLAPKHLRMMA